MAIESLYMILDGLAQQLRADLRALMAASRIEKRFERQGGALLIVSTRPFSWKALPDSARALQNRLRDRYREFAGLVDAMVAAQPSSVRETVTEWHGVVFNVINQDQATTQKTVEKNEHEACLAIAAALAQIRRSGSEDDSGEAILVPDTNALYANPALDSWAYADCPRFALALVPAVVGELDRHKDDHPNPAVKKKAQGLVRLIGEFRRRGRLVDGVTVRAGRSRIFSWAREPQMDRGLQWLDRTCADDRLLVSTLDIARTRPLAPIAIVTRDLNLQSKCELARVSFLWPPKAMG